MNRLLPLVACLAWCSAVHAAGSFTVDSPVAAVDQPQGRTVVGTLNPGTAYPLLKQGGPARAWCKVKLDGGAAWVPCNAGVPGDGGGKTGGFSYYVLSLSWSPAFCLKNAEKAPEQCAVGRQRGFVVHGLWPQNEKGWPENCGPGGKIDDSLVEGVLDLMPSRALVAHEWKKHGTCSGLTAREYLSTVRAARAAVKVPAPLENPRLPISSSLAEVEQWFMAANPGLRAEMISVECKKTVSEVRLCLDKQLHFRACGSDVADRCKGPAVFPPPR